jgi:hypothetical protein
MDNNETFNKQPRFESLKEWSNYFIKERHFFDIFNQAGEHHVGDYKHKILGEWHKKPSSIFQISNNNNNNNKDFYSPKDVVFTCLQFI